MSTAEFFSDGKLLARGHQDNTARLWEIPSGNLKATLKGHVARVPGVAFSPDGQLIHTPEGSFSTTDWKPVTPLQELPDTTLAESATFRDVDVTADGAHLLHTVCTPEAGCQSSLSGTAADLSALNEAQPFSRRDISSEGHWVAAGGVLVHWPSDSVVKYAEGATAARFAPNGDVVAGFANGDLARYCRSSPAP